MPSKSAPPSAPFRPATPELDSTIDAYLEERRKQFVRGFARFVIEKGHGARRPAKEGEDPKKVPTWQEVGRQIYGKDLFNQVLSEEIEAKKAGGEKC